jgi:hypothetical protein
MPPRSSSSAKKNASSSSRSLNLDLTQQLTDYGCYHSKGWNQVRGLVFLFCLFCSIPYGKRQQEEQRQRLESLLTLIKI